MSTIEFLDLGKQPITNNFLTQQKPIIIDVEVKNDLNQGLKIIAKRLMLLEEFIVENKFNLRLMLTEHPCH